MSIHAHPAPRPAIIHVRETARPVARDHREVSQPSVHREVPRPIVRDHREPVRWDRDRDRDRDHDRDDRGRGFIERERTIYQPSVYTEPTPTWAPSPGYTYQPQPILLAAPTALASDQLSIDVGGLGAASVLELGAAGSGSTYVSQVVLVEADGDTQVVPVNQVLSPQNPTVQLPLGNGAAIARIVVDGHSDWGGELMLRAL